jgi:hypothetical protein
MDDKSAYGFTFDPDGLLMYELRKHQRRRRCREGPERGQKVQSSKIAYGGGTT